MPMILDDHLPSKVTDEREKRRKEHHDADVVIIGAGVVGCAIAVALAKQDRSVILLERSLKEPDRIVGELLQPGGVKALEELGLGDCLEGIDAIPVKGYDVIYYGEPVEIPYPDNVDKASRTKRPEGRSFHHGRFIQKLRAAAMREPNVTVFETEAKEFVRNGWTGQVLGVECEKKGYGQDGSIKDKKKDYFFGHLTIVADGYASKFRKGVHTQTPSTGSKFYGLELIDADLPLPYHGHVLLGDGAPVLLYQIGTHETRALVDVPENTPTASVANGGVKGHLKNVVLPSLPKSVQPSFADAIEHGGLRSMPNSLLPASTNKTPGMILLGDALNMRHPLTGGGMTVAFNDVVLMAELLSPTNVPTFEDNKAVLRQMRTFHWRRKEVSATINILAHALYSLFAADDSNLKALQMGCFRYFQRGGTSISEPAGLLGGIIRQPLVLFWHFFAVAFYAIYIKVSSAPVYLMPWALLTSWTIFWKACVVIFPYIYNELRV